MSQRRQGPVKQSNLGKARQKPSTTSSNKTCYTCGSTQHLNKNCPKRPKPSQKLNANLRKDSAFATMFKEEFPSSAQKRAATRVIDAWGIPSTCAICLRSQHEGPCEEEDSEIIGELPNVLDQLTGNRNIVKKIKAAYGPEESAVTINASFFATNDDYNSSQDGNDYIGSDFSDRSQSTQSQSSQTQSDSGSSRSHSQCSSRSSSPPHSDGHNTESDQ